MLFNYNSQVGTTPLNFVFNGKNSATGFPAMKVPQNPALFLNSQSANISPILGE